MIIDKLAGKYLLKCTHPGCYGEVIAQMNLGVGWSVGQVIPMDPSRPEIARCPICKRHKMRVESEPEKPKPPGPKGFTKVPTE